MTLGAAAFALLVWGSLGAVVAVFALLLRAVGRERRGGGETGDESEVTAAADVDAGAEP
ncbi:hypothetical protein [Halobaculum sp. D14]|uniref:hypothetical protein n=1 Tax=unclassified Halobaculum TaxID=2640896 RepID=UPI003EBFAECE